MRTAIAILKAASAHTVSIRREFDACLDHKCFVCDEIARVCAAAFVIRDGFAIDVPQSLICRTIRDSCVRRWATSRDACEAAVMVDRLRS